MQLPALFYGLYRDVKRRTTRIVNQIPKGADWMALVEAEGFLDTDTTPGYIVLQGPNPMLGGEPNFQAWLLLEQIWLKWREWGQETMEAIFQQSLSRPWSMLGLVSGQNNQWFIPKHRYRPFLRAVRQYWDLFDSVGQRYTDGARQGFYLWSLPNSISFVLANMGIPNRDLDPPLPPGGLAELIDRTERHLH